MDYYRYLVKKLGEVVIENQCDFILYPFGEKGALIKGILNGLYGIQETGIIDNILCSKYKTIESLDYLKKIKSDNFRILITSDKIECYDELRNRLYTLVDKEKCIELLPVPFSIEESRKNISKVVRKMEEMGVSKEKPVYHPRKTKSNFYLPFLHTDFIQSTILLTDDYYERTVLDKVFLAYKNGAVKSKITDGAALDVGANIGNHTLYMCNECNVKKVYCFEPVELTFSILETNIKLNHLEKKVVLNRIGLGEKEEKGSAEHNIYNLGGTRLKADIGGDIPIKSLDDLKIEENIAFIKIDVEGMEENVIKGGMGLISKNRPYIMIESFGDNFIKIKKLLCEFGYTYESLDSAGNWLFCP